MTSRSSRRTVVFAHPFSLRGPGDLRAGAYIVETDEESVDELSFLAFRRVATLLEVSRDGTTQVFAIDPVELDAALIRDVGATVLPSAEAI